MRHRFEFADAVGVLLVAGAPIALVRYKGWPPTSLPDQGDVLEWLREPLNPTAATAAFVWLLWLAWFILACIAVAQVCRWVAARVRLPRLRVPGPVQAFTAAVLGATAVSNAAGGAAMASSAGDATAAEGVDRSLGAGSLPGRSAASADGAGHGTVVASSAAVTSWTVVAGGAPPVSAPEPGFTESAGLDLAGLAPADGPEPVAAGRGDRSAAMTYTVAEGDWLWHVAGRFLGDPHRYRDLAALNPHLAGKYADFPDHVEPGDVLRLPGDARDAGPRRHARGTVTVTAPRPAPPAPPPSAPAAPPPSPSGGVSQDSVEPAGPAAATPPAGLDDTTVDDATVDDAAADQQDGVALPGGWVTIGLAASLCAAAALVWARRRVRYDPAVSPDPDSDGSLRPLPAAVTRLRRAVDRQAPQLLQPPDPGPTVREYARMDPKPPLPPPGPSGPELAGWGRLPQDGLGLTGPGARAAARAMLVATLSAGHPLDPDAAATVVIPDGTLTGLFGPDAAELAEQVPRLLVTADLSEALAVLHQERWRRAEACEDADVATVAELRERHPDHEPLPPMLLITDAPEQAARSRLRALVRLADRMDVGAVVLGDWPEGTTVHVNDDGVTTGQRRLSTLDEVGAGQMLAVLREAHTGQPPPAARTEPSHTADATGGGDRIAAGSPADDSTLPEAGEAPVGTASRPPRPAVSDRPAATVEAPAPSPAETGDGSPAADAGIFPVRVQVLGKVAIYGPDGTPVAGLRRKAAELLAYLATHRGGADLDDVKEALFADAPVSRAKQRLATDVANLRACLRAGAGITTGQSSDGSGGRARGGTSTGPALVINTGGRYILAADLVTVDWWQVQDAVARAGTAPDTAGRIAALRQAVEAFHGLLYDYDGRYDWATVEVEVTRRHGVAAHTQLAQLVAAEQPDQAARYLQVAADLDPLNESVAVAAMRAHAAAGDVEAVRARYTALVLALRDHGQEPGEKTAAAAAELCRGGQLSGQGRATAAAGRSPRG